MSPSGRRRNGSKCNLVAPSGHDRSRSRSRLELKPEEGTKRGLASPIGLQKGIGTLRPARSVVSRERASALR